MLNTIKSYAKINLFLNVVDKLDTGFHELNSVLSRIDLYDEIRIKDESSFSISYNGPFGDQVGSNDHVSKLFNYLIDKNYLKQKSFAIHVVKNIPVGSGLGGGSSNVAEIIKYLIRSNLLDNSSSTEIARDLGSDIEFFIDEGFTACDARHLNKIPNFLQSLLEMFDSATISGLAKNKTPK